MNPHWERGYRCHGYWQDFDRVGFVSLTPPGFPVAYHWERGPDSGNEKRLINAKAKVEASYHFEKAQAAAFQTAEREYAAWAKEHCE